MRGLLVHQPGEVEGMDWGEIPARRLEPTQVRVEIEAVGVNPVDASNRTDPEWAGLVAPYVVGYEFSGHVREAGGEVHHVEAGSPVWGLLPVRGTRWGAYAQEVVTDARHVTARPRALSAVEAAAVPLAGATALQLLDRLDPAPGEWMLIHGAAGGVGHLLVQMAHHRGARIAAPASPVRHSLLHELGVELVVDRHDPDALLSARHAVGGGFPVVADLVGSGRLAASIPHTAEGGRLGSIVELAGDLDPAVDRNLTLHGVLVRSGVTVLTQLAALVEDGSVRPVIDEVLPLSEAARAHERVESGSGQGKLVLTVST